MLAGAAVYGESTLAWGRGHLRCYLCRWPFPVWTKHSALQELLSFQEPGGQVEELNGPPGWAPHWLVGGIRVSNQNKAGGGVRVRMAPPSGDPWRAPPSLVSSRARTCPVAASASACACGSTCIPLHNRRLNSTASDQW